MMERDFLGLSLKDTPVTVKEEASDGSTSSASLKGSGMHWSFSNKVSAIPRYLSFKASQEDRPRTSVNDPLVSSGFIPMSAADAFDSNQKPYVIQKNVISDRQGGNRYVMKTYGQQHMDAYPVHRPQEGRIFPVSSSPNQTITVSMSTPALQSRLTSNGQHLGANVVNPQPLGGVPIMASPISVLPASTSVIGTTDIRYAPKPSGAPAQLTIFYDGSVSVYDDVSPEKAQAIMLLAGNGSSMSHNKALPTAQVQATFSWPSAGDCHIGNKSYTVLPCSALQTPLATTTHVISHAGAGSSGTNELTGVKPIGALASSGNKQDPPKVFSSVGSAATTLIPAVALPQSRKASLARFLEKRKERVMNTLPYSTKKKSPECGTPGSECVSFSVNSGGSGPFPASDKGKKGSLEDTKNNTENYFR